MRFKIDFNYKMYSRSARCWALCRRSEAYRSDRQAAFEQAENSQQSK